MVVAFNFPIKQHYSQIALWITWWHAVVAEQLPLRVHLVKFGS